VTFPKRILLPAVAAAALAAAGCGGDDNNSNSNGGGSEPPAQSTVGMKNIKFQPESIRVKVGQEITWTNDESVPHDVAATSGADFQSETFGQGGTFKFTPAKAGTIEYECTLHPGMDGTIEVVE
jgi:plastocyanin